MFKIIPPIKSGWLVDWLVSGWLPFLYRLGRNLTPGFKNCAVKVIFPIANGWLVNLSEWAEITIA